MLGLGRHEAAALLEQRLQRNGNGARRSDNAIVRGVLTALVLTALYSSGTWLLAVNDAQREVPGLKKQAIDHEERLRKAETQRLLDDQWRQNVDKKLQEILDAAKGRRR